MKPSDVASVLKTNRPDIKNGLVAERRLWKAVARGLALLVKKDEHAKFLLDCGFEVGPQGEIK